MAAGAQEREAIASPIQDLHATANLLSENGAASIFG